MTFPDGTVLFSNSPMQANHNWRQQLVGYSSPPWAVKIGDVFTFPSPAFNQNLRGENREHE